MAHIIWRNIDGTWPNKPRPYFNAHFSLLKHGRQILTSLSSVLQQQQQQSQESEASGLNIWGIAITIVAAVAAVVIGILVWRQYKDSRDRSPKSANIDSVEECSQQQQHQQQRESGQGCSSQEPPIGRPSQKYDHAMETSPEYVDLYDQGFDHYDSPKEIMRRSGEYETPQPVAVSAPVQDYVEPETVSSAAGAAAYHNMQAQT
ncbi:hypothetical protein ElyMa_002179400 [Elysia marginata]|uniref:Uncharacterized protein n=1 Tax=Elysia marginata TaxID=1093978 RepID=A0AAV4FNS4_9GAST|nr:hypothetical protein ElyMa_002179400 [Elysia marginata]